MTDTALTRRIKRPIARTLRRKKRSELSRRIACEFLRFQHLAQALKCGLRAAPFPILCRSRTLRAKLLRSARRPCHRQVKSVAEMPYHPIVDHLMIFREKRPHFLRIRQQEIEMTAARIEQGAPAHRAGSKNLIGNILQQDLQIERAPAKALQSSLRRNRIDERLDARNVRRYEQIHRLSAHTLPALARRMLLVVRNVMRLEILKHRARIRRCQAHMIIKRNIGRLSARCARRHIAQNRLQYAQKLIELHITR